MARINEQYEVIRILGTGSGSAVYLVSDMLHDGTLLALKTLRADRISADSLKELRKEFSTLARLGHPNLVRVYHFGKIAVTDIPGTLDNYFFTVEYVDGINLFDITAAADWEQLIELTYQLAHALDYVHRHNLIHFDIKPDNILVIPGSIGGEAVHFARLVDFGFASTMVETVGKPLRGTLDYMAPELLSRGAPDHRLDFYSLGITLFHVITRRLPFQAVNTLDLIKTHLHERVPPVRTFRPDIPPEFAAIIDRLCDPDPEERFARGLDLAQALRPSCSRAPIFDAYCSGVLPKTFIGLQSTLEQLQRAMDQLAGIAHQAQGDPPCTRFYIVGEQGTGKTHLLEEIKRHAQTNDIALIDTACISPTAKAYEPFIRFSREFVALLRLKGDAGRRLLKEFALPLGVLLPEFEHPPDTLPVEATAEEMNLQFIDSFTRFIERSTSLLPCVVWVDDLHLADEGTLEILRHLIRTIGHCRLLLCISSEVPEPARQLMREGPDANSRFITLSGLTPAETAQLAESILEIPSFPLPLARQLVEEIGGSPYVLREYLSRFTGPHALQRLKLALEDPGPGEFPRTISELYARRLNSLGFDESLCLKILSCLQGPVELELFLHLVPFSPMRTRQFLTKLLADGLITAPGTGQLYQISHAQFRTYIYNSIAEDAPMLHRMIAEEMEHYYKGREDEHAQEIAHHYAHGGIKEKAYHFYLHAAQVEQSVFSLRRYVTLLEKAARLVPSDIDTAAVNEQLAKAYALVAEYAKAEEMYLSLLSRPSLTPDRRSAFLRALSTVQTSLGHLDDAARALDEASALVVKDMQHDEIEIELAAIDISRGRYAQARQRLSDLVDTLDYQESFDQLVDCINKLGIVSFYENRLEEAKFHFNHSLELLEPMRDPNKLISPLLNMGNVFSVQGKFEYAEDYWHRALILSKKVGNLGLEARIFNNLGIAQFSRERFSEAKDNYRRAMEIFLRLGNKPGQAMCMTNIGEVHFALAEYEAAARSWNENLKLYEELQDSQGITEISICLASLATVFGDIETCQRHLAHALEYIESYGFESQRGTYALIEGMCALRRQAFDPAYEAFDAARDFFKAANDQRNLCVSTLRLGMLLRMCNKPEAAADMLAQARTIARETKAQMLEAEILYEFGLCAQQEPQSAPVSSFEYFREAYAIIERNAVTELTAKTCLELARAYRTRGLRRKAHALAMIAEKAFDHVLGQFSDMERRTTFLQSCERDRIREEIQQIATQLQQ